MPQEPNPIVWDDPDVHVIETMADGVVDRTGAFCRTNWRWASECPELLTVRAKFAGEMHSQEMTLATIQGYIANGALGTTAVYVDGERLRIPTAHIEIMLPQIADFSLAEDYS